MNRLKQVIKTKNEQVLSFQKQQRNTKKNLPEGCLFKFLRKVLIVPLEFLILKGPEP